ncbi:ATP-binding cassette domain-containing protein [Muricauda sp. MAR_2010_75]|jgi:ABC-type multidrug transport system ATPase subunit|uniref:ATP-binding cassette domain-containing protein n=1 Tax=Allomuricauda sp. MAR_2010_75 TaxID=1250232 RepID=UPI00056A0A00|nr:ATP-binding cassette domain-containing protein [Muricauda sp. MAR_2010_75]
MILEVDNIELNFGTKRILSGIYICAKKGAVTGILGRNGSGKTSLLKIIFGCLTPKYKSVRIDSKVIRKNLFLINKVAYLPQHPLLPKTMKVQTAFTLFEVDWDQFSKTFESFKIYQNPTISELSSGEVKVLETYLILHQNKKIIFLDEPFSFISPLYVEKIKSIIAEQKKDRIILITDHFYKDILEVSDNTYFLTNGHSKLIKGIKDLENEGYTMPNSR